MTEPSKPSDVGTDAIEGPRSGGRQAWLLWFAFLLVSTATQVGFKIASKPLEHLDFGAEWLRVASGSPAFGISVVLYLATFALWIVILQRTPLSRAFLLTALVYVTVIIASGVWLGESVNAGQLAGIALIIAGVGLLGAKAGR